eukprot:TRINITY_DN51257_c0_g1_i1.p1 TRINITY_DN51257_c0_g1~~TRINITY_DN51257_c0_g1_i1.p1  ORF type:complete len:134 (+),score=19.15 TRINITY_DN51257_c0_g1_i1:49-402(+)
MELLGYMFDFGYESPSTGETSPGSLAVQKLREKELLRLKTEMQQIQRIRDESTRLGDDLHRAVESGNAQLAMQLLRLGANPCQKNARGQTPREVAMDHNKNGSHSAILARLNAHCRR